MIYARSTLPIAAQLKAANRLFADTASQSVSEVSGFALSIH